MREILLTQGKVAFVDDADYSRVIQFKWCVARRKRRNYAQAVVDGKPVLMHNWLLGGRADHRDGNGLNNTRSNIRLSTHKQNAWAFQIKRDGCTSRYRGVSWEGRARKWKSGISTNKKYMHLGYFSSEEEAARAYNTAALTRDPDFHHLNEFTKPA